VDNLAGARAAGCPRTNITATGCPGTVRLRGTSSPWKVGHASRETDKCRARDADAGWQSDPEAWRNADADGTAAAYRDAHARDVITDSNADTNTNPDSNANPGSDANADSDPNAGSRAPGFQPRLRHRDGKRGVDQPDWE
jgi:hypothetical protein